MSQRDPSGRMLVVDDDPAARRLAAGVLERGFPGHAVDVSDGTDVFERIAVHRPLLVVTDLYMPGTDGLQVVERVRREHPDLPVVVMTAHGSEQAAVRALRAGAASYVSKHRLSEELIDTVRWVLAVRAQRQKHTRIFEHQVSLEREFVLPNQTELIPPLVTELQSDLRELDVCPEEDLVRFGVAISEALMNAIIHGNLGLPGRLVEQGHSAFSELVRQRMQTPPYAQRRVYLRVRVTRQAVVCTVRDEGEGFDPATLPDPTHPEALERPHGRGLLLIRTFMDETHFNATGNELTMVKRARPRPGDAT